MKKEDILAAAQQNKFKNTEYENNIRTRGDTLASLVAPCIGIILFIAKYFTIGVMDMGLFVITSCSIGIQTLHEGIKLKKWYYIILGIFLLILCFSSIILFVGELMIK